MQIFVVVIEVVVLIRHQPLEPAIAPCILGKIRHKLHTHTLVAIIALE